MHNTDQFILIIWNRIWIRSYTSWDIYIVSKLWKIFSVITFAMNTNDQSEIFVLGVTHPWVYRVFVYVLPLQNTCCTTLFRSGKVQLSQSFSNRALLATMDRAVLCWGPPCASMGCVRILPPLPSGCQQHSPPPQQWYPDSVFGAWQVSPEGAVATWNETPWTPLFCFLEMVSFFFKM